MKHRLAIIGSGLCIGLIGVLVKLIGNSMPAMSLNFFRMLIGLITLAIMVPFFEKDFLKVDKDEIKDYAIVGFLIALAFSMFVIANLLAPVSNVVLINSTYVIFTAILAFFFLKEKFSLYHLIAIGIAVTGMFLLNPFIRGRMAGSILAFFQAMVFAVLVVYMRKVQKDFQYKSIFWFFAFATLFLLPFPIIYGIGNISSVLIYLIPLGVISTGIAYFLFAYGIQKVSAEESALLSLATFPTSSILFAFLLIKEPLTLTTIIGGLLLITAGLVAIKKCKHKGKFLCV